MFTIRQKNFSDYYMTSEERAFCEGYEYAQREFANSIRDAKKQLNKISDKVSKKRELANDLWKYTGGTPAADIAYKTAMNDVDAERRNYYKILRGVKNEKAQNKLFDYINNLNM